MIHILDAGRTLCGMQGTPNQWPIDDLWVGMIDMADATCAPCINKAKEVLAKQEKNAQA